MTEISYSVSAGNDRSQDTPGPVQQAAETRGRISNASRVLTYATSNIVTRHTASLSVGYLTNSQNPKSHSTAAPSIAPASRLPCDNLDEIT